MRWKGFLSISGPARHWRLLVNPDVANPPSERCCWGWSPGGGLELVNGRQARGIGPARLKPVRRDIQMVFQDPGASLDSRMTVGDQVAEPLLLHCLASSSELKDCTEHLFKRVSLSPDMMARYPHEFSGGQRQRINIARALSLSPKLIIADEGVSALDVSVQAQVPELLQEIQDQDGLSFLFISHDMAVIEQVADRVMVMRLGQMVEKGARDAVLRDPRHDYTKRLLSAVAVPDPTLERHERIEAENLGSPIWPAGQGPEKLHLNPVAPDHRVAI